MEKKVIVLLAEGFEEVEAVTPVDYLRRAGLSVTVAALGESTLVKGSHGITVTADAAFKALDASVANWDAVVIPGGVPGADNIAADKDALAFIVKMATAEKVVAAICAAPARVLAPVDILIGRGFTCYPGLEKQVHNAAWNEDSVVVDGGLITSRAAGTAGLFSIAIIEALLGEAEADKIAKSVLL